MSRTATQAQIKSQFYKLSKELHPDVNPSEDAKKQFQAVSEAYATLGNGANRKAYDRQSSPHYGDNVATGAAYRYNADDNANRRARATYAWDYHRRRRAPQHPAQSETPHDSMYSTDASAFETLAAKQRAREAKEQS